MFNIQQYDYLEPIKKLSEYYISDYYIKLYEKYKNNIFSHPLNWDNTNKDYDEIMLQYIKCFKNMALLLCFKDLNVMDILQNNKVVIHGYKKMSLTDKQYQGIIHQLYYDKIKYKNIKLVKEKQKRITYDKSIYIILYEPIVEPGTNVQINIIKEIKEKYNNVTDLFYCTNNINRVIDIASTLFNHNSMDMLTYQRLVALLTYQNLPNLLSFDKSREMFMKYKKWLQSKVLLVDQIRFLLHSSCVLFALGSRLFNDIDILIYHIPQEAATNKLIQIINNDLINHETSFKFTDVYTEYLTKKRKKKEDKFMKRYYTIIIPKLLNIKDFSELFFNPEHHFYYLGIKFISINNEIIKKKDRIYPASYADLIALNKINNIDIGLLNKPEGYWSEFTKSIKEKYIKFTQKEIDDFYKRVIKYLKYRYDTIITTDDLQHYFL